MQRRDRRLLAAARFLFSPLLATAVLFGATSLETLLPRVAEMIQANRLAEAAELLDGALREFPKDPRLYNFQGVIGARRGETESAEKAFRNAIALAPEFMGAYLNLGRFYQERSGADATATDKALKTYQELLRFAPHNEQALFQTATLMLRKGEFQGALEHIARLPREAQQRAVVVAVRCGALTGAGNLEEAERAARQLAATPELSELDVLPILPVLESKSQTDLAVMLLESLARQNKASPAALYRLGLLQKKQGNLTRARSTLEQAFREQPKQTSLLIELAQIAHDQQDYEGALGYLAHARDLQPEDAAIHFFFGMVCVEMDLPLEAKDSLQRAVNLAPDRPYYNYALGAVLLTDKDAAASIDYFGKFRELRPDDPHGHFGMGLAYYHNRRPNRAREELEKAAGRTETAAGANYYLGRIAMQAHDNAAAVDYFRKAIEANSAYAEAYADLGLVYTRLKKFKPASEAVHHAVKLAPDGYRPNLNLLVYYQRTKDDRAEAQRKKFERIKEVRSEQAQLLLRRVEVRPPE